ncbi:MAG: hypothetical protein ACPLRU_04830 [Desulfofundulus sp.]
MQLTLFGEEVGLSKEEIERRKKKEEEKKRKELEAKKREEEKARREEAVKKAAEKENPPDDMERVVCYARERRVFPAGVPLEEIRKQLAQEFWELTGDNVKMVWEVIESENPETGEKTKNLIVKPLIGYARKGAPAGVDKCYRWAPH